ncbi:MAG: glycosyl hydrolase family 18 protein [Waddliaceae bacterium]
MQIQPNTPFFHDEIATKEKKVQDPISIRPFSPSLEENGDLRSKNITPIFTSYWCGGYREEGKPIHLNRIPKYIDVVPLGFAALNKDSTITTDDSLLKNQGKQTLKEWIQEVKSNGQKVLVSIGESNSTSWADPDPKILAQNAKELMEEWDLDGFDFHAEGSELSALKNIIPVMRQTLGKAAILTYTCDQRTPQEKEILKATLPHINWIQTMTYELELEEMISMATAYAHIVGKEKVVIGVKVGIQISFDSTPLDECQKLAEWVREEGFKGMMLYSCDADTRCYTGKKEWSWARAVHKGLGSPERDNPLPILIKENPFNSASRFLDEPRVVKKEQLAMNETVPLEVDSNTLEPQKKKKGKLASLASRIGRSFSRWCCCCK